MAPRTACRPRTAQSAIAGHIWVGIVLIALLGLLGGCGFTAQGDFVREAVATKGAQAADEGLKNATWFICQASPIGAIKRAYGVSQERAFAYNNFCPDTSAVNVLRPGPDLGAPLADGLPVQ